MQRGAEIPTVDEAPALGVEAPQEIRTESDWMKRAVGDAFLLDEVERPHRMPPANGTCDVHSVPRGVDQERCENERENTSSEDASLFPSRQEPHHDGRKRRVFDLDQQQRQRDENEFRSEPVRPERENRKRRHQEESGKS